jgi:hypothetical protein
VHEREPAPQQLEEWEREAGAGRAEAAATLAAWYRRLELGPEELGGVVGRDASPDEARWTERAVELGGFPYAWRAVDWAARMEFVNTSGHEYADEAELEAHLDSLAPDDEWQAWTVNCIGIHGDHPRGPWAWIDGSLTAAMTSTMLQILVEETQRAGLTDAVLRSGRRASQEDHTPNHA